MTRYAIIYDGRRAPGDYEFYTQAVMVCLAAWLDMSRVRIEPV